MRQATVYYINYYTNDYNVARYEVLSTVPSAYYCNCFFTDDMYSKPPQHIIYTASDTHYQLFVVGAVVLQYYQYYTIPNMTDIIISHRITNTTNIS